MATLATLTQKKGNNKPLTDAQKAEAEKLAYQFYLERGGQHGNDMQDWLKAEAIVRKKK